MRKASCIDVVGGDHFQEPLVGNHDQGVDRLAQPGQTLVGLAQAHLALEVKRPGDDPDREGSLLAGDFGNDRRGSGPGAAPHPRGHENHVRPAEGRGQIFAVLLGGSLPLAGVAAGTEPLGELGPDLKGMVSLGILEGLQVGVDGQELDTPQPGARSSCRPRCPRLRQHRRP